jgi:hypothetical protein
MSKTRNQRKQEIIDRIVAGLFVGLFMAAVAMLLCGMCCVAWNHPAEEPITYEEHMERFGGINA